MFNLKIIYSKYLNHNLNNKYLIFINISTQCLTLYKNFESIIQYKISSSKYGEGSEIGSYKTPLGAHYIKEVIGIDVNPLTIFKERVATREIAQVISKKISTNTDVICSRILWLDGLDEGKNKGSNCDSYKRFIYLHGTNEEGLLGEKASHGCIRMSNNDIIELCNNDIINTFVYIS